MFKLKSSLYEESKDGGNGGGSGGADAINAELIGLRAEKERMIAHQEKLLNETKEAKNKLKAFDGFDPDNLTKMMKHFESSEEAKLIADGKIDEVISKRIEKTLLKAEEKVTLLAEQLEKSESKYSNLDKKYTESRINGEIRKQAEKAGVIPSAIDDVVSRAIGVFSIGDDGAIESRDAEGHLKTVKDKPLDPALFIEQLKDSASHFWPNSQGSGASGGSGFNSKKNPFKKGSPDYNMTEQAKMYDNDPQLAARMKAAAG